jgi:hypothetical protein
LLGRLPTQPPCKGGTFFHVPRSLSVRDVLLGEILAKE